jgi:hypothetical protein
MNDDELSTKLSTACGDRTAVSFCCHRRGRRGPGLVTVVLDSVGSRLGGHPRFVVCRRFVIEAALAEANSFLPECQPFCNILTGQFFAHSGVVTAVANVKHRAATDDRSGEV